jgi:hypothetical protein
MVRSLASGLGDSGKNTKKTALGTTESWAETQT